MATSYNNVLLRQYNGVDWDSINLAISAVTGLQNALDGKADVSHKYHNFSNGQYFFDSYEQGNNLRLFTETANFDQFRFQAISNVEYYNGTSWLTWVGGDANIKLLLDGREETGFNVTHTYRRFRFTVQRSGAWPTLALLVLQETWTGLNHPNTTITIETWNGTAWTLKDTTVFGAGTTGNGLGIHMKATSTLHDGIANTRVTVLMDDWTDNGSYTEIPLRRLMLLSNFNGGVIHPWTWNYDKTVFFDNIPKVNGTDLVLTNDARLTNARPASDVYSWAKDGIAITGYTDANDILFAGFYYGNNLTNAPTAGWYYYIVNRYSWDGFVVQYATSFGSGNTQNKTYTRTRTEGVWGSWVEVYTTGNFNPANYMPTSGGTFTNDITIDTTPGGFTSPSKNLIFKYNRGNLGGGITQKSLYVDSDGSLIFGTEALSTLAELNSRITMPDSYTVKIQKNIIDLQSASDRIILSDEGILQISTNSFEITAPNGAYVNGQSVAIESIPDTIASSRDMVASDRNKFLRSTATSGTVTYTARNDSAVYMPIGSEVHLIQGAAGAFTVSAGTGVTLYSEGNKRTINAQWQAATLKKIAPNTWLLIGALKA